MKKASKTSSNATSIAKKIKEIAISEFFAKNRHLLGFDNPLKSLLTTVREAIDNALDACEEALILPDITVIIKEIDENKYQVSIEDNGPGIVKAHMANIFGKLLYGSKFHRLKQSRGQQGIGISAAVMYGQMTTGKPAEIISKIAKNKDSHKIILQIDTKKNAPKILSDNIIKNDHWQDKVSGTKITIDLEGAYKEGKHGVLSYIKQTSLANPHAAITFIDPKGHIHNFKRLISSPPSEPKEIKPHPLGLELGTLMQLLAETTNTTMVNFLTNEFSKVSPEMATEICALAQIKPRSKPTSIDRLALEKLFQAIKEAKLPPPATNCLSPLGEEAITKSLYWFFAHQEKDSNESEDEDNTAQDPKAPQGEFDFNNNTNAIDIKDDSEHTVLDEEKGFFLTAISRPPSVYRGNPFQIEVGLFYGKSLKADDLVQIYRYANRVPLQYQQAACAITKAVVSTPWKSYGLAQSKGSMPQGPVVLMIAISSVWVPYTSESKEAVAHYPEIIKELRLALMEAGRRLSKFLHKRNRYADEEKKRSYIEKYLSPIKEGLVAILKDHKINEDKITANLELILSKSREHKTVKMGKKIITTSKL